MNNFEINFDDGESMIVNGSCNLHPLSHFKLPVGTTAQRPSPAVAGMFRFNTEIELFEGYNGNKWNIIGGVIDSDKDQDTDQQNLYCY